MKFFEIEALDIDGNEINVVINKSKTGTSWIPLVCALLSEMKHFQIEEIIYKHPRTSKNMINYDDITRCFVYIQDRSSFDYNQPNNKCICGVKISNVYYIMNVLDAVEGNITYKHAYPIGSECINHWNAGEYNQIIKKERKQKNPESKFCGSCNKKVDKKRCKCNENIVYYFESWKEYMYTEQINKGKSVKLGFGKYKTMSYHELVTSKDYRILNYKKWMLSDDYTDDYRKNTLHKYILHNEQGESEDEHY